MILGLADDLLGRRRARRRLGIIRRFEAWSFATWVISVVDDRARPLSYRVVFGEIGFLKNNSNIAAGPRRSITTGGWKST